MHHHYSFDLLDLINFNTFFKVSGVILPVNLSTSAQKIFALIIVKRFIVGAKLTTGIIIISFSFIPAAKKARCNAAVPLEHETANFDLTFLENSFSKRSTIGPVVRYFFKALLTF